MNIHVDRGELELAELEKREYKDLLELKRAHIEQKNKYRNLTRCLNTRRVEDEEDTRITNAKEPFLRQQEEVELEENLAIEMRALKNKDFKEKKMRQQLRENSQELRDLEAKLRAAYVSKELMAQIAEKEAMKIDAKMKEKEAYDELAKVRYGTEEYRTFILQKEMFEKAQYRQELHDQMILKEKNKRFQYEEFLREKKLLDDVIQRLHDEDVRAIQERMLKMKKTQEEIDAFVVAQKIWRDKQKIELELENRQIQEYLLSKGSQARKLKEDKERLEACKERISNDIAKKLYEEKRSRQEREEIIMQLQEEEMKDALEKRHKADVEKQERSKIEVRMSLTHQMEQHREEARKVAEADIKYREELIAKIIEDERVEQMTNEKKKRKMIEIRKEVERTIILHRQQKAEDMQRQMKIIEIEKQEEEERLIRVREERIKLLQKHAKNLIGFLPPGLITAEDLEYLGSEYGTACAKRDD